MYSTKNFRLFLENAISADELSEVTKFQKYALYGSSDAKKLSELLNQAQRERDEKKAQAIYKEALTLAESLRKKAMEIPANDFGDWAIDLLLKPTWWFIGDAIVTVGRGHGLGEMSRSQAISHFDAMIRQIKLFMNRGAVSK